ncbi:MAG: hypothetical protein Q7T21_00285 [Gallionella sp.]|nr:hypothetical protein [Gallionella sp.]
MARHREPFGMLRAGQGAAIQQIKKVFFKAKGILDRSSIGKYSGDPADQQGI